MTPSKNDGSSLGPSKPWGARPSVRLTCYDRSEWWFIRRVLLHVLPRGFHRLRYYGLLANRTRRQQVAQCRHLLGTPPQTRPDDAPASLNYRDRYEALTGRSLRICPRCRDGQMQFVDCLVRIGRRPAILDSS